MAQVSRDIRLAGVQMPGRKDEAIWDRAKKTVTEEGKYPADSEQYWKVVQTVYESMGGT